MKTIQLTQGYVAIIDDRDFERVTQFKWHVQKSNDGRRHYAAATFSGGGYLLMHRLIMGVDGPGVDHKDSNGLNNRRRNLRQSTQSQNLANQRKTRGVSRFKGVVWVKARAKWQAQIASHFIGRFDSETDAALAYNKMAAQLWGEFARLNDV